MERTHLQEQILASIVRYMVQETIVVQSVIIVQLAIKEKLP